MATAFAPTPAAQPAPFVLGLRTRERRPDLITAERLNTRARVARLLCELGTKGATSELALTRNDIAEELGIGLCKVKRVLALLSLSGVLSIDGGRIGILDWRRLCAVAQVEHHASDDDDAEDQVAGIAEDQPARLVTASGEPACFV